MHKVEQQFPVDLLLKLRLSIVMMYSIVVAVILGRVYYSLAAAVRVRLISCLVPMMRRGLSQAWT